MIWMRRTLVVCGAGLAGSAIFLSDLPAAYAFLLLLLLAWVVYRALRRAPGQVRLTLPEPGIVLIRPRDDQPALRGRFDALYASGPYCALRIRDPAHGNRVVGLFRDELPPEAWRRLQVALRVA